MHHCIFTYACPIWGITFKSGIDYLSLSHNNQLRFIRNGNRHVRNSTIKNDLTICSMTNRIKFLSKKFYSNIHNIPNDNVYDIFPITMFTVLLILKRTRYTTIFED